MLFLPLLASCDKWGSEEGHQGRELIYLAARHDGMVRTKVPYDTENGKPSPDNHLNVEVWASTFDGTFLHKEGWDGTKDVDANGDNNVEENERAVLVHTKAFFQSDQPQLLSQAIYPPPIREENEVKKADPVYFVGLYPQSVDATDGPGNWTTDENGATALYTFNGSQDLMYAPKVQGQYNVSENQNELTTTTPTLHFHHLLTRFNVSIGADLESGVQLVDIEQAWGKVIGLKIQCYDPQGWSYGVNSLTVDLAKGMSDQEVVTMGAHNKTLQMDFYMTGKDVVFPDGNVGYKISEMEEVAYVMCAPVEAVEGSDEYVLIIETQKENQEPKTTELFLNLKGKENDIDKELTGSSMGKEFNINLVFKKTRAIAEVVAISPWETGGQGSGDIKD